MKVSQRSIFVIGRIVTGNQGISPYRSGPQLVRLFNEFGAEDVYDRGFPSRWDYAEQKLRAINGTPQLNRLLAHVLHPREMLNTEYTLEKIAEYLNAYLKFDGYELVKDGEFLRLRNLKGVTVEFESPFIDSEALAHIFIDEQIGKCERKLADGDFDGAITNARSLIEAVLSELERGLDQDPPAYDGDLPKLYKRVQKLLNLEPDRTDIEQPLKQVLGGLTSIVAGLAAMRNKMSDSHVRSYKPARHHAKLVVNAAKTLADFLFETKEYQAQIASKKRGK